MEVRRGTETDCNFLASAIRDAERAHTTRGLWDILIDDPELVLPVLARCCQLQDSIYFYERFYLVWDLTNNKPVASACGYCYPELGVGKTLDLIMKLLKDEWSWTDEQAEAALKRLSNLENSFPTNIDWENGPTWMIEAVYTDSEYRRQGLGRLVVSAARSASQMKENNCQRCWITCSVGNDAAFRLYESLGFVLIGDGRTIQSDAELKFHVLEYLPS
jgi:ribosomal protein S18 acetylase RimI-like enzyme